MGADMPIGARRVFRISLTIALSLAIAYGMAFPLPYLAPIFVLVLSAQPAPPMGLKGLLGLILVLLTLMSAGLLLIPMLVSYPVSAVLIIAAGLYFSTYLTVKLGKALVGTLLTLGITIIPAAGLADFNAGVMVVKAMALGMGLAVVCQWLVYPLFPEDPVAGAAAKPAAGDADHSNWIALRVVLIVLPPFLMALANPSLYLKLIMKTVALGQQGCAVSARTAGQELLGSTFLGGCFAILFWFVLKLQPSLWMFFLWMLLFGIYFSSKLYRLIRSRYSASFWVNVFMTMLILLGSAVQDSANGDDVYKAFMIRMALFIAVTLYAWLAIYLLERLRTRRLSRKSLSLPDLESSRC